MNKIKETSYNGGTSLEFTGLKGSKSNFYYNDLSFNFDKQVKCNGLSLLINSDDSIDVPLELANIFKITLTGTNSVNTPTNIEDFSTLLFIVEQNVAGDGTLSFSSDFKFEGGTAPTITASSSAVDIISGICYNGTIYCSYVQNLS